MVVMNENSDVPTQHIVSYFADTLVLIR